MWSLITGRPDEKEGQGGKIPEAWQLQRVLTASRLIVDRKKFQIFYVDLDNSFY